MPFLNNITVKGVRTFRLLLLFYLLGWPALLLAEEEMFSFDLDEIEKNPLVWGGYAEFSWEHMDINQDSVFNHLNFSAKSLSDFDRLRGTGQLFGRYDASKLNLNWLLQASGQQDDLGWTDTTDIFALYGTYTSSPTLSTIIGKKSYKWGKGYAWNPVGFINRPKDPNNPNESLEGFVVAEVDYIKTFGTNLQSLALTTVVLPVVEHVNEDFGSTYRANFAAKLYLLYRDTDIDLLFLAGDSRANRVGLDFSRNIATNFEIHAEFAYIPHQHKLVLEENDSISNRTQQATSLLLGLRYLSNSDVTTIVEYYHNGGGYSTAEMNRFYELIREGALNQPLPLDSLLDKGRELALKGYGRPQSGRNYIYAKITKKEPFAILYLTPGITSIVNIDDHSYSFTPELVYTRITNLEMRLRLALFNGGVSTEYGEKAFSNKAEFRVRYFF